MNKIRTQVTLEPVVKKEAMKILEEKRMKLSSVINNFNKEFN